MQTTYGNAPGVARKGQKADAGYSDILSYVAEAAMTYGLLCQRGTTADQVKPVAALPSADTDSIATALATAASAQIFSLTDLDGVIGDGIITPAQRLTFTLNSHADWDDTDMTIVGLDADGNQLVEVVRIPNGGNATIYTASPVAQVERIHLPAQTGTNGTMDVGTDPTYCAYGALSYPGVVVYDPMVEAYATATEVAAASQVSVMRSGRVRVEVEAAVTPGLQVYVRAVESGADLRGQFRGTPAANFFPLLGAYFVTTTGTDGFATLQLGGR